MNGRLSVYGADPRRFNNGVTEIPVAGKPGSCKPISLDTLLTQARLAFNMPLTADYTSSPPPRGTNIHIQGSLHFKTVRSARK